MTAPHTETVFTPRTVSLGLYTDPAEPGVVLERLFEQARAAEAAGFSGVTISEHHGGFPAYVPNPLQVAGWILDRTDRIWAGPCPLLLPLRPAAIVAEEVCWLASLHPGRVGVGFAPGYRQEDFEVVGLDFDDRARLFDAALGTVAAALRGEPAGPLAKDPAVGAAAHRPVPFVVAAGGVSAARRAGGHGGGILTDSLAPVNRIRRLHDVHGSAGGADLRVVNRRVWVGDPPRDLFDAQLARYRDGAGKDSWMADGGFQLVHGGPDDVAGVLTELYVATGATHLSLKVHVAGVSHEAVLDQITALAPVVAEFTARLDAVTGR